MKKTRSLRSVAQSDAWRQVPRGRQYSVGHVLLLVLFVLSACAPLRCAGRIFEILDGCLPISLGRPHWSTGLLLGLRALVSTTTADVIRQALESSSTKPVWQWCRNNLGQTVQPKRKYAYKTANT